MTNYEKIMQDLNEGDIDTLEDFMSNAQCNYCVYFEDTRCMKHRDAPCARGVSRWLNQEYVKGEEGEENID